MKAVKETPGVGHFAALGGLNFVTFATKPNSGTIFCQLKPWDERETLAEQVPGILDVLRKNIAAAGVKQANVNLFTPPPIPGVGQTAGFTMEIEQQQTSDDVKAFEAVVNNFVAEASKHPAIGRAATYYGAHTPSYSVTVTVKSARKWAFR